MGKRLSEIYKNAKRSWKTAFFSALVIGLIAHLYKFTNTLPNHDALYNLYSAQNMIASGRWLLSLACLPSSYFDLPWVNGLLSLVYIGLTAAVIADIFRVENPFAAGLAGALLAVFPCVTNSFFFEFTADGYMLAMLLSALAARLSLPGDKKAFHWPLAALLLALSCGIYQAYVSFALLLALCAFIWALLRGELSAGEIKNWVIRQFLVYGLGLLAYYLVWKLAMGISGVSAGAYQGMDSLGKISPASLVAALKEMLRVLASFFMGRNVFQQGFTLYAVLNLVFLLLFALTLGLTAARRGLFKKPGRLALGLLSLLAMPFFACVWLFVSPGVSYHLLMLQSLAVLYIFTIFLFDGFFSPRSAGAAALFFTLLVGKFALQANVCYFEMEKCARLSQAQATEMLCRIHLLDKGEVEYIAFVGGGDSSLVNSGAKGIGEITVHAHQLRQILLFDHTYASLYLTNYMDSGYLAVSPQRLEELEAMEATEAMAPWPAPDSVRLEGDTVIIKLPEP